MAVQNTTTIKNWFLKGKFPLAQQFADWIDSFWHKTQDAIPMSAIDGLSDALDTKQAIVSPTNYTWADQESANINVGTDEDQVIELKGALTSGNKFTLCTLTIIYDGTDVHLSVNFSKYYQDFQSLFTGAALNGNVIQVSYDVGNMGDSVKFSPIVTKYQTP